MGKKRIPMIKKIKKLLGICTHRWVLHKTMIVEDISFVAHGGLPFHSRTEKQCYCSKCGKWKTFKI